MIITLDHVDLCNIIIIQQLSEEYEKQNEFNHFIDFTYRLLYREFYNRCA